MTAEIAVLVIMTGIAIAVVLYIVWSNRHLNEEWDRKRDQERLWQNVQGELNRTEIANFRRHTELQRQLAEHQRILKYLARRLS